MKLIIKLETVEEWIKRTGKRPKALPKGEYRPIGKHFKFKDVGKGTTDK